MSALPLQPFGQRLLPTVWHAEHDGERWCPGGLRALADVPVTVAGGTVQYALSVFEGLKAYRDAADGAHLFRASDHALRLQASARRLALPAVPEALFLAACSELVRAMAADLPSGDAGALYLRPTLYASDEGLGLRRGRRHGFTVMANPCIDPPRKSVRLWAESQLSRAAPGGIGGAKAAANYAAGIGGLLAAQARGYDDVLWLDAVTHTELSEAGTMNVFAEIDGVLYTPLLDGTLLAGITRDTVLQLAPTLGLRAVESVLPLAVLRSAAGEGRLGAVFGTGTACRLVSIVEIGTEAGVIVPGASSRADQLYAALSRVQRAPPEGWRLSVSGGRYRSHKPQGRSPRAPTADTVNWVTQEEHGP